MALVPCFPSFAELAVLLFCLRHDQSRHAGTAGLIGRRGSGRDLFLRLLFALDHVQHHGQKPLPSSRYVPLRATISDL